MTTLLAFALAIGILVTFHELGHYWVARWCGVRVLRFSVGFGKVLARRTDRHGTEWALSAIPLGGYVKMMDEAPAGAPPQEAARAFDTQPVAKRFAIVAAGPVFNLVLAALLYAGLYAVGTQEPAPILAQPVAGTPAASAGVQAGDTVIAVNGEPVTSWGQTRWAVLETLTEGGTLTLEVAPQQGGRSQQRELFLPRAADPVARDMGEATGLRLYGPVVVRGVVAGSSAERAGLQAGDRIVAVAGRGDENADGNAQARLENPSVSAFIDLIQRHPDQALNLQVQRGTPPSAATLTLTVVPTPEINADGVAMGRIGAQLAADVAQVTVRHGVLESLQRGVTRTVDTAWLSLRMMGRMVTGEVSVRNISGPVTIADYAGQTARIGVAAYVAFLALISVSLGILNLLPIPMLDGGHLFYYLIEIATGRKPSERWLVWGQRTGAVMLAGLMSLALVNDLLRLFA